MKKTVKDRMLQWLKRAASKCRLLTYPAVIVMVIFLSIYHTFKAIFTEEKYHKTRRRVAGGVTMAVLVLAFVVWPSFAEENLENPEQMVEEVQETEEPLVTPETTVVPIEPTDEPESTEEPDSTTPPTDEEEDEGETEGATPAPEGDLESATETPQGEEGDDDSPNPVLSQSNISRSRSVSRTITEESLSTPTVTKSEDLTYTYKEIPEDAYVSVEVNKDEYDQDNEIPSYQWYLDDEKIDDATRARYKVPTNLGVGEHVYKCVVTMLAIEDTSVSKEVSSSTIKVTIEKANPSLEDFSYNIKSTLYYNGKDQTPTVQVKEGIQGMGNVRILCLQEEAPVIVKECGEYELKLVVDSTGTNYNSARMPLGNVTVVSIGKPSRTFTVNGEKGNKLGNVQWYKSDVSVEAPKGYTLGKEETGDYTEKMTFTTEKGYSSFSVYYKDNNTGGIWGTDTVPAIGIDKTSPEAELKAGGTSVSLVHFFQTNQTITLEATDNISDSGDLEYYMYVSKNNPVSGDLSKVAWAEKTSVTVDDATQYYVYGKVVDEAGNITYVSSEGIVIDAEAPHILCGGNPLKDNLTYTADEKTFSVEDENLSSITYQPAGGQVVSVDVEETNSFTLKSPETEGDSTVYTIVAKDKAQNETTKQVTLVNPVPDCNIATMDFGSLTYGYETDGLAKAPSITRTNGNNVSDLYFEKVMVVPDSEGEENFTAELNGAGGFTVTPKSGLHVGTYRNVVRVDYKGISDEEATKDSTTKFVCELTVTRATVHATYKGHTAYYHTIPDFTSYVEVNEEELKNNDTLEELKKEDDFSDALVVEYKEENGQNKRAMETDAGIKPVGGYSRDYEIVPVTGTMTVTRRNATKNVEYYLNGTEGTDGWFTSDVAVGAGGIGTGAPEGYLVGNSENAIASAILPVSVTETNGETAGQDVTFYVMNKSTGEIFYPVTETVKIDKTAPFLADGQGISIATNLWRAFWNTITFEQYFNDTMAVTISGSDALSGLDEDTGISYYVSSEALTEDEVKNVSWSEGSHFSLEPDDLETKIVYARIMDRAGLSLYISSNGMVFDNKVPAIEVVKDGEEYITEQKEITVSDSNLIETTLYEGTDTTASGTAVAVENFQSNLTIDCPEKGSKTYTVVAKDSANNLAEKSFTITKPIYDITANRITLKDEIYGYAVTPASEVTWKNTEKANADATISQVTVSDTRHFEVVEKEGHYYVAAKKGLDAGKYSTDVFLTYNNEKIAETTAIVTIQKATLTAKYKGQNIYFHMTPDMEQAVEVTGFVNGENEETAAGYVAPTVTMKGTAQETDILIPAGGKADNYEFVYEKGVLIVNRRKAVRGADGQYDITGKISDTGWYISDITITPKAGFVLVDNEEGIEPKENIVLTEDTGNGKETFFVMNENTGEIYEQSVFEYRKDIETPVIQGVKDGETYVVNSQKVTIQDDYLASVTVNGASQEIKEGTSEFVLSADQVNTVYVLVVTDYAGNVNSASIVLKQPAELEQPEDDNTDTEDVPSADEATPSPTPTSSPENTGTVKKKVTVVEGAPKTAITTKTAQMMASVLSEGEQLAVQQGSSADVELRVQNIDGTVSQEDKELIISNLGGYSVGEYLDITLWKTVGSSTAKKVHDTNKAIAVTITVPENLRNKDSSKTRTYAILRVHNGVVSILPDKDSVESTVTFNTDRFSTYVLAYKDTVKKSNGSTGSSGSGTSSSGSNILSSMPDMGDHAPITLCVIIFVAAFLGIVTVIVVRKKCS